jgi:hypothetical protein
VYDLRKLLAIAGKESMEESQYLQTRNEQLKSKVSSLNNALKYSLENGKHLQRCAMYWG